MKKRVLLVALMLSTPALAVEHEIRVHTDRILEPRERSVEVHANVGRPGEDDPDRAHRVLRLMPQLNYGFMRHWQAGIHLPLSYIAGDFESNGVRTEVKYVAPHDKERGPYWGAMAELAYSSRLPERGRWSTEVTPIFGWRIDKWHFAINPRFDQRLSGEQRHPELSPSAMVMYKVAEKHEVGFEHHAELGPIRNFRPIEQQKHVLYAAWRYKQESFDMNLGVGRGLTDASDSWVAKMLFEVKLK